MLTAPIIPGLNDHEIPALLAAARAAGALYAGYVMLRLPHGIGDIVTRWLEQHFPLKKDKILKRINEVRGGRMNDPHFGSRMQGEGVLADAVKQVFEVTRKKLGFPGRPELSTDAFQRPNDTRPMLFEGMD